MFNVNKLAIGLFQNAIEITAPADKKTGKIDYCNIVQTEELFSNGNLERFRTILDKTLAELPDTFLKKYTEVDVLLPDPLVFSQLFVLSERPRSKKNLAALLEWKLSTLFHYDKDKYITTYHDFGKEGSSFYMLTESIESTMITSISSVLRKYDLVPNRIDAGFVYLYEHMLAEMENECCSVVQVEKNYWTIIIIDNKQRLRFQRSRWINSGNDKTDIMIELSKELERAIRAFAHNEKGVIVKNIIIKGESTSADILWGILEAKVGHDSIAPYAESPMQQVNAESGMSLPTIMTAYQL